MNEQRGLATVREGNVSIEVLALRDLRPKDGGTITSLDGKLSFNSNDMLAEKEALEVARQRLRLPLVFAFHFDKVLEELQQMTDSLPQWHRVPLLRGSLYLLFDENCSASLAGFNLTYSQQTGLVYEKENGNERA